MQATVSHGSRTVVVLSRRQVDNLPSVCICCGANAVTTRKRTFRWTSGIDKFIDYFLAVFRIITIRWNVPNITVQVPLCQSHKHYWSRRLLLLLAGIVLFAFIGLLGAFMEQSPNRAAIEFILGVLAFVFFGWLVVFLVVRFRTIKVKRIDAEGITLNNVAREFAEAVGKRGR
jgi:hypothetical protein